MQTISIPIAELAPITIENANKLMELLELRYYDENGISLAIVSVAFNHNTTLVAGGSEKGSIVVWNTATGEVLNHLTVAPEGDTENIWCIGFGPENYELITTSVDTQVGLWNLLSNDLSSVFPGSCGFRVNALAIGQNLLAFPDENRIRIWDIETNEELIVLDTPKLGSVNALAFSPGQTKLAVSIYSQYLVEIWDLPSKSLVDVLEMDRQWYPIDVAFSPDGTKIATANFDGTIRLWNIGNHGQHNTATIGQHSRYANRVGFAPDGRLLASTGNDQFLRLWDIETAIEINGVQERIGWIHDLSFSHDGRILATAIGGAYRGAVRLYGIPKCAVKSAKDINLREGPGIHFSAQTLLSPSQLGFVISQTKDERGITWWQLSNGLWARSDTVTTMGTECEQVGISSSNATKM